MQKDCYIFKDYKLKLVTISVAFILLLISAQTIWGQGYFRQGELPIPEAKPAVLDEVKLTEKLGDKIPLNLTFTDETGKEVKLADYYNDGKPVVINLGYYNCPMLCGLVTQGLTQAAKQLNWKPGDEYRILTISFDHTETPQLASDNKDSVMVELGKPLGPMDWAFLTGTEDNIRKLTEATGFGFKWDERTQQYAHPAAIVITSPDGTITKYMAGIVFPSNQLKFALLEASNGQVGSILDQIVLMCFQYDHTAGKYTLAVTRLMRFAGWATVIILGSIIGILLIKENKKRTLDNSSKKL